MNGATLGALAGFFSALVVLGIPIGGFLLRQDRRTRRILRLVTGDDDVEEDGVLPRLRDVEETTADLEDAVEQADVIEYPRVEAADA